MLDCACCFLLVSFALQTLLLLGFTPVYVRKVPTAGISKLRVHARELRIQP